MAIPPFVERVHSARPIAELIGFTIEEISAAAPWESLQSRPELANQMRTLHGGILCAIADSAMGMGVVATPAREEWFTTVTLSIHLSAVERGTIQRVLGETGRNKSRAARRLGLTRTQLYGRLKRYCLEAEAADVALA